MDFAGFLFVVVVEEEEGVGDDGGVDVEVLPLVEVVERGVFSVGEGEEDGDLFCTSLRGGGDGVGEGFGGEV